MTKTTVTRREGGFTLLELLLVIGVAALLLIGGIATYRLVSDGNKATEATRLLLTIRQEAQVIAQQQGGSYTDITFASTNDDANSPLVIAGVLRNQQRNPFNGTIDIAEGTPDGIEVIFAGVSQSSCLKMSQAMTNPNEVISVSVNGTALTFPISVADAATACGQPQNEISWVFP